MESGVVSISQILSALSYIILITLCLISGQQQHKQWRNMIGVVQSTLEACRHASRGEAYQF